MRTTALVVSVAALVCGAASLLGAQEPRVLPLWPEGVPGRLADGGPEVFADSRVSDVHDPSLTVFPAPRPNGAAVIVCPGGAYMRISVVREGSDVAERLNAQGVSAFVLRYRLEEYGHPAPLRDVLRAIRLVRSRAVELGVRRDRIGVLGFSAGGHLAASAATLFDAEEGRTGAALDAVDARPDFAILVYPVILLDGRGAHEGSRRNLLGPSPDPALVRRLSVDSQVTARTPPTLLIHTAEDATVPIENSLAFYEALRRAGVPAELHLFPRGRHGFGLDAGLGTTSLWMERVREFMEAGGWTLDPR
jgi:acetyl esterase/lipase